MTFVVREMRTADRSAWAEMRSALWPEESASAHAAEIDDVLRSCKAWGFIVETRHGDAVGFAEIAIRKYANGCDSRPVAFLEGIWVKPQFRRQGAGAQLVAHAESFLAAHGFHELGSDTQIDNTQSQDAHRAWGFSETERVVYFRKLLRGPP
jgi:aminoglycoside 6'-N-acetyltransferase I